jgi:hypothetical protein
VNVPPAKAELPVFVTVRVCAELVVPVAQFPKDNGLGVTVAVCVAATPVPESATGEPVTVTLPVIAAEPVTAPAAVGINVTVMVQVEPAVNIPVQVPPALVNGPVTATVTPVRLAPPVFDRVRVCAALVTPTTLLKVSDVGETLATAYIGARYSTAPMSIAVLAISGLGLPKKSVDGAIE